MDQVVKKLPAKREIQVWPLDWEEPLEKGMIIHWGIFGLVLMLLVFVCTGIMNRFGADEEGGIIA